MTRADELAITAVAWSRPSGVTLRQPWPGGADLVPQVAGDSGLVGWGTRRWSLAVPCFH